MVARPACRDRFARFGGVIALSCVIGMTAPPLAAQEASPPPAQDAEGAIARSRVLPDPVRRCGPIKVGEILVCGSDTDRNRLSPELRAIAGVGQDASPQIPRAEAKAMSLDKLPYNWMPIGGRYKPGPEYNPLYEMAKRATDPETGTPALPEEP